MPAASAPSVAAARPAIAALVPANSAGIRGVVGAGGSASRSSTAPPARLPGLRSPARFVLERAATACKPQPAAPRDPDPVITQFQRGLAAAVRQQGGTVTLRLEPAALGAVRVRMELGAGRVGATFEAATDQARHLLDASLGLLRSALEAHGLDVHQLDVKLAQEAGQGGESPAEFHGGAERQAWSGGPGTHGFDAAPAESERRQAPIEQADSVVPDGVGIGMGGALVRLRLDTVG